MLELKKASLVVGSAEQNAELELTITPNTTSPAGTYDVTLVLQNDGGPDFRATRIVIPVRPKTVEAAMLKLLRLVRS